MNRTMKACVVLVTHTVSMGDQYSACFHCFIQQICFFPWGQVSAALGTSRYEVLFGQSNIREIFRC